MPKRKTARKPTAKQPSFNTARQDYLDDLGRLQRQRALELANDIARGNGESATTTVVGRANAYYAFMAGIELPVPAEL